MGSCDVWFRVCIMKLEEVKQPEQFRNYVEDPQTEIQKRVKEHYYLQHRYQTYDFVKSMHKKWLNFDHAKLPLLDCLDLLSDLVDASDPDVEEDANIVHAYQTAERMREAYPDRPWLHLVGLIHDLGKVMSVWGEVQYAVTGDTFPVGCMPAKSIVYGIESFAGNPDITHPVYSTKLGIYEKNCGLENVTMAWSHDEYMYQVLKNHPGCTIPEEALYAIRFHSFYPYHNSGEYMYLANEKDAENLKYIFELNNWDLYSKSDEKPDIAALRPYYQSLVDQYAPGPISF
uniref:Inositol oxygenase n=1 Tax=Panagrellus redivivus TaxID=6233 RepID=A0A7E4V956_PANRE